MERRLTREQVSFAGGPLPTLSASIGVAPRMVSVIIPAFNVRLWLATAIDSVLRQTYRDVEVVIIDDGSTDGTAEIAEAYGDRVRFLRQHNRGVAAARNAGIRVARGRYIAFVDGDDFWEEWKLEAQVRQLEHDPHVGLVYADYGTIGPSGVLSPNMPATLGLKRPSGHILRQLFLECVVWTGTVVVRREVLEVVGLFDEGLKKAEDYDMWLRIASRFPIDHLPKVVAWYRIRPGSLMRRPGGGVDEWQSKVLSESLLRYVEELRQIPRRKIRRRLARPYFQQAYAALGEGDLATASACYRRGLRLRPFTVRGIAFFLLSHLPWLANIWIRARITRATEI